jgi:hypothetical protein
MKKTLILPILLIVGFYACSKAATDKDKSRSSNFKSLEISYSNGWTKYFSFHIDSDKIFLASPRLESDTIEYGILPDSTFSIIDSTLCELKTDTSGMSYLNRCSDCGIVALKATYKDDTIKKVVTSTNSALEKFLPLINILQQITDNGHYGKIRAQVYFETLEEMIGPPPILTTVRFKPPLIKKDY